MTNRRLAPLQYIYIYYIYVILEANMAGGSDPKQTRDQGWIGRSLPSKGLGFRVIEATSS